MIESFKLANIATYNEQGIQVNGLKEVNFFYGANGCGKTTASNYLTDTSIERFQQCNIKWLNDQPLPTLVYNKAFRDKNFGSSDIAGVFTLGEATTEQVEEIKSKKSEQDNAKNQLTKYTEDHKKKLEGQIALNTDFTEKCWSLYKKYGSGFKEALKGSLKRELFKDRIISIAVTEGENHGVELKYEELKIRGATILGQRPKSFPLLAVPEFDSLHELESDSIWQTVVAGQSDVDISGLIEVLGCQDWVNHGRQFIHSSDICPFCQKPTIDDEFRKKIELFFDTSFEQLLVKIKRMTAHYNERVSQFFYVSNQLVQQEKQNENSKLDIEEFELALKSAEGQFRANIMAIENKLDKPSSKVDVNVTKDVVKVISLLIIQANKEIAKHNEVATNYDREKKRFISDVWIFLVAEIQQDFNSYHKKVKGITKAVDALGGKVDEFKNLVSKMKTELAELSRHTTSVQPAVNEINRLLMAYGFVNFEIVPSQQLENHYVIQRQNGELAFESLSEGEVTFITLLYFVQLANGALTRDAVAQSRVVVIDDPISSLDSNVLYIVSAIVKGIIKEVKDGSSIKQLLLFTHNVYFHKEASFQNGRSNGCNKTHFWIFRKANNVTSIQSYEQQNPINSAYELMWQELKDRKNRSGITIQNTMRRILENYFKILGKFSDEDIVAKFENHEEQQICLSLLHWINDGSHCIPDDLFIQAIDDQVEVYLTVFKNIFLKSGHESHYDMMMCGEELFDGEANQLKEVVAA
ncbi:AAA family ATPase [Shewanella sp. Arc9-LZ]|uniref:AAA family ATPase n=1 Tax=Shewanella sp. Arc9-LZ TaxID=2698686 RepID=UPI00137BF5BD|nr:AAA family ATPase [Shewanella sp. Arc9-LZ]QHS13134.1 AAA family ATPase [Shewanella sp. Arc9-LZ]